MVTQGAPKAPKWYPRDANTEKALGNGNSLKGAGGNGRNLKTNDSPHPRRGSGVIGPTHHSLQNLHSSPGLPTAASPSKLEPQMLHFSNLNFSTLFLMQNLQNLQKNDSKRDPVWRPKDCRNDVKVTAQYFHNHAFRAGCVAFLQFCSIANKNKNDSQMESKMTRESFQIGAGASQKRCQNQA